MNRFVRELHEDRCRFGLPDDEVKAIEDAIHYLVKVYLPQNLALLPENHQRFTIAQVISSGSYYEETKIGNPDEFDFMLVAQDLSQAGAVVLSEGCKPGHVKVAATGDWGKVKEDQTANHSFELALLAFNLYVRLVIQRSPPIRSPTGDRELVLKETNVVVRGKTYKELSYVQTVYFVWRKRRRKDACMMSVVYSQTGDLESGQVWDGDDSYVTEDILDIDVDMMACCHAPVSDFRQFITINAPLVTLLDVNGCHIVLKPCGNGDCQENDTECRLVSYTNTEREIMRDLDLNWKSIYKVMKWLLGFSEILGLDSYRLKTVILHLSQRQPTTTLSKGMLDTWAYLRTCTRRKTLSGYFDQNVNLWNVPEPFDLFIRLKLALLMDIFQQIEEIPAYEYDYGMLLAILEAWAHGFCRHQSPLLMLETSFDESPLTLLCEQGNTFLEVLDDVQPYLEKHRTFNKIPSKLKASILLEDFKVLSRIFCFKFLNFVIKYIIPAWMSTV